MLSINNLNQMLHVECAHDERFIELRTKLMDQTMRSVCDTQDQLIRAALIKMGWTPPQESHSDTRTHVALQPRTL